MRRLPGFRPAVAFLAVGAGGNHLQGAGHAQVIAVVRLLAGGGAASSLPEGILVLLLIVHVLLIILVLLILLLLRFMDVLVFVLQALLRFHEAQMFLRLLMVHLQELRLRRAPVALGAADPARAGAGPAALRANASP